MLDKLLTTVAANAKLALAAAAGAALVAGGSAVAISNVADSGTAPTAPTSAANEHISDQGLASRSDTATVGISPKPSHSPKADNGNAGHNHGACVSAVAKASPAANAQPGDHGSLVSAAAKSDCGKTAPATSTVKGKSSSHKPAKATTHTDSSDDASESPEPSESPDSDSGTPSSNGTTHSNGHAGGH